MFTPKEIFFYQKILFYLCSKFTIKIQLTNYFLSTFKIEICCKNYWFVKILMKRL